MILDGKALAYKITEEIKHKISSKQNLRPPGLAVVLVGDDPASEVYVRMKKRRSEALGMYVKQHKLPSSTSESEIKNIITNLNQDSQIDGILVQLPLPKHVSTKDILSTIDPSKDVDGLHPINMGKLVLSQTDGIIPCTPKGVLKILEHYKIPTEGANITIVGRSHIVGMPLLNLLSQNTPGANGTVTIAHSKTRDIKQVVQHADILICAVGKPAFITKDMIKSGATVIDVGTNRVDADNEKGYEIVGDIAKGADQVAKYITPSPGGVGPMTIAMLIDNTYERYCIHENI